MFTELFVRLRAHQVGVTLHEWLTLMEALERGLIAPNLTSFYYGARAILVKREADFDRFDEVFLELYRGIETGEEVIEGVLDWLDDPKRLRDLSEEEMAALEGLDLDRLRELFEQRLKEQTDRHDGGNRWIGTGGTTSRVFTSVDAGKAWGVSDPLHVGDEKVESSGIFSLPP